MARKVLVDLDFNGQARCISLLNPSAAQDAATKSYVDSLVEGLAWKDSCRVATQANITIAAPGNTIDGISMATNDRVLVRSQSTQSQNGIYVWNGAATPMTRTLDANTADELEQAVTTIEEGTSAGATFRQTTINFTLETGNVVWTSFGTAAPSASESTPGIAELATQAETDTGTDDLRIVTPLKLATWSGRLKKFSQTIGDGAATSYTVTHNLNTNDTQVTVYRVAANYDEVLVDVEHTSVNSVTIKFASAPSNNQFRVVVIG